MLSDRAIRLIADAKIDQAIAEGDFDDLPGFGRPFEFDDTQYDPNWWIRRKLERERLQQLQLGLAQSAAESANSR